MSRRIRRFLHGIVHYLNEDVEELLLYMKKKTINEHNILHPLHEPLELCGKMFSKQFVHHVTPFGSIAV